MLTLSSEDSMYLDDSLTSLQWLQDFSIPGARAPQPPLLQALASPQAADPACTGSPVTPGSPTEAAYSRLQQHWHSPDDVNYNTDAHIKPPYSYATLICLAMKENQGKQITLSSIYSWITANFCYYRKAEPSWQNSIRHQLSLNKGFIKVPRQKGMPGKGGFWTIDQQYSERLLTAVYKKSQVPPVQINPALRSRFNINPQPRPRRLPTISLESRQSKDMTGTTSSRDPHLREATIPGEGAVVQRRVGCKRKQPYDSKDALAEVTRCSSDPLLLRDKPAGEGTPKGDFDWDAVLYSALGGELNSDEGEPLSPVVKEENLTVQVSHIPQAQNPDDVHESTDFEDDIFLDPSFLGSSWLETDENSS